MKTVRISFVLALIGVFLNSCSHTDPTRSPASLWTNADFATENEFLVGADLLKTGGETPAPAVAVEAETEIEPWVRVAQSEIDPNARKSCAISALLISYLDETDEKELGESVRVQIEELKKLYGKKPNKLQKKILKDLARVERHQAGKDDFKKVFTSLCKVGRAVGGTFIRTGALAAGAVTTALTMPIRFTFKAGIGVFSRKLTPDRGVGYSEVLGGRGFKNWSGPFYQTIRVAFFSGNPLLLGVYGLTSIDLQVQTMCRSQTIQKTNREEKFCANYEAIKRGEFVVTEVAEKFGVKVGKFLLHTFDFKSDGALNSKICEKSPKRQVKIALKARERLEDEMRKSGYANFTISIVPPEVAGCVEVMTQLEKRADRESFESKGTDGFIDGIAITVSLSKEEEEELRKKEAEEKKKNPPVVAEATPTPDPDRSDEKLCQNAFTMQGAKALHGKENFALQMKLLQVSMNPVRFASLELKDVISPTDQLRQEPASARGRGKNVVYIVAPNEKQKKDYAEIAIKLEAITKEVKANGKKLQILLKEKSYESCLAKQEEIGFDWKKQEELIKSLQEMSVSQRVTDFDVILKEAKKMGRRFFILNSKRMKWEIREYTHINQFREVLMNDEIRNVVFVSHADSTGKIIDSNMNLVPASAFSWISPNIQSISLFACHTDQLIKTFHIDERLKAQENFFPVRYIGMVDANEIFEKKNQAPSPALSEFLEDLDRELFRAEIGNERAQTIFGARWPAYEKPQPCELSFPGIRSLNGAHHIQFVTDGKDKYWAGVIDPVNSEKDLAVQIPCNWIGSRIELGMENAHPTEESTLESTLFHLRLKDRYGRTHEFNPFKIGRRPNQSIRSVKWKFEKTSEEGGVIVWKDFGSPETLKPTQEDARGD